MATSRYGGITGTKKISDDFENINKALVNVEDESDQRKAALDSHINNTGVHVTAADKTNWNSKASGTELTTHMADDERHLTAADRDKLDNLAANVKAFSQVNDVVAKGPDSKLNIKAGPGIIITTNPATGDVTVTSDGGGVPDKHGTSHNIGGADEIPDLSRAVTEAGEAKAAADEAKASATEALTLAQNAESKASVTENLVNEHTPAKIYDIPVHGLRVIDGKLQFELKAGTWKVAGNEIQLSHDIGVSNTQLAASAYALYQAVNNSHNSKTLIIAKLAQNKILLRNQWSSINFDDVTTDKLSEKDSTSYRIRLKEFGVYLIGVKLKVIRTTGNYLVPEKAGIKVYDLQGKIIVNFVNQKEQNDVLCEGWFLSYGTIFSGLQVYTDVENIALSTESTLFVTRLR